MDKSFFKTDSFFNAACYFEASLAIVALVIGWLTDINPFQSLHFSESAIAYGIVGTLPLFLLFLAMEQWQHPSVTNIREFLLKTLGPGLNRYHWTDLLILAAIAGIAEELLFRGVLQPWIENHLGKTAALIGSNLLFGLAHAVTPLYALLAGLVGWYLAFSMDYSGERNLLTPIIIHGLYDFLAFVALMRVYRAGLETKS